MCILTIILKVLDNQTMNDQALAQIFRNLVGFRLKIPTTCHFSQGEPKHIIYTGQSDDGYDCIKRKDKNSMQQLRSFMMEKIKKRDERLPNGLTEEQNKYFEQYYQMTLNRMKNKKDIVNPNLLKIQVMKELKLKWQQEETNERIMKEAILCRYLDGITQVLSEQEFLNLCLKRKEDQALQQIHYIQSYYNVEAPMEKINFHYKEECKSELFLRARREISIMVGEISKWSSDYVSLQEELQYESEQGRQYIVYKIVHFVEMVHHMKILKCQFIFQDDKLVNVRKLQSQQVKQHFNQILEQKQQESEYKMANKYAGHESEQSKLIEQVMYENYEDSKKLAGITVFKEISQGGIDGQSDEAFQKLHPGNNVKLTKLLKSNNGMNKLFKQYIWTDCKMEKGEQSSKMFDIFAQSGLKLRQKRQLSLDEQRKQISQKKMLLLSYSHME